MSDKHVNDLLFVGALGNHHGSLLLLILMVDIHSILDQELHCVKLATSDCIVYRSLPIVIYKVSFSSSRIQLLAYIQMSFSRCIEQ